VTVVLKLSELTVTFFEAVISLVLIRVRVRVVRVWMEAGSGQKGGGGAEHAMRTEYRRCDVQDPL
jgi:hypothetical protein